ncbi:MAG: hypothetical protein NC453_20250 [Muribaculum sp.]|nr:hypothetical protein [Muribaculum sp.]
MVPVLTFVGGVIVGYGLCKLSDVFKDKLSSRDFRSYATPNFNHYNATLNAQNSESVNLDLVDISSLAPLMSQYGVDPASGNGVYVLCNKIKTETFKKLLEDVIKKTSNGEELISFLDNVNIPTFSFPKFSSNMGTYTVHKDSIEQLIKDTGINSDCKDVYEKIELLINLSYASAIDRFKKNFGSEITALFKARDNHADLSPYYKDLIMEVQVSRDFLNS